MVGGGIQLTVGELRVSLAEVTVDAPGRWLQQGWSDFRKSPLQSLIFGVGFVLAGYLLFAALAELHDIYVIPFTVTGFILVAPVCCWGFYGTAACIENGNAPRLGSCMAHRRGAFSQIGLLAAATMMVYLAWLQTALLLFALFFGGPGMVGAHFSTLFTAPQALPMVLVGTLFGTFYCLIIFTLSVVSVPLLFDRHVSAVDAIWISMRAVWLNRTPMLAWAITIGFITVLGLLPGLLGLLVAMPVLGYASWHAYRDLVKISPLT